MALVIRQASADDLTAIERLLADAHLPPDGLTDQFPDGYAIAELDREYCPGQGVGEALVRERLAAAQHRQLEAVYALTTTAADYLPSTRSPNSRLRNHSDR